MLVYAIRHAESEANTGAEPGLNTGLSGLGMQQAEALALRFRGCRLAAIYSSPFRRCLDSVLPIARQSDLPIRLRSELWEYHNLPPGTMATTELPDLEAIVASYPGVVPCPDVLGSLCWPAVDETFQALLKRIRSFAAYLKGRWPDPSDSVLVMSHGTPVARLIETWLLDQPGPSFRFVIDNAAVTALRYAGGVSSLVCLNEISHLRGLQAPLSANYTSDGLIRPVPPSNYW